jgi:hypothetical protein
MGTAMALGQAAGTLAAIAGISRTTALTVDHQDVQAALNAAGALFRTDESEESIFFEKVA